MGLSSYDGRRKVQKGVLRERYRRELAIMAQGSTQFIKDDDLPKYHVRIITGAKNRRTNKTVKVILSGAMCAECCEDHLVVVHMRGNLVVRQVKGKGVTSNVLYHSTCRPELK